MKQQVFGFTISAWQLDNGEVEIRATTSRGPEQVRHFKSIADAALFVSSVLRVAGDAAPLVLTERHGENHEG